MNVRIPFGNKEISFNIPGKNFVEIIEPRKIKLPESEPELIEDRLNHPIGTACLEELAKYINGRVSIIIDDNTRLTPTHKILSQIISRLTTAKIRYNQIKIVIATGTHRAMNRKEIIEKIGRDIYEKVSVTNHIFNDRNRLSYLGSSKCGIDVWLSKDVVNSDMRVVIGSVIPHAAVGWAGGAKMLYPGVAGEDTIRKFHVSANLDIRNRLGEVETPIRHDIEKMVSKVGLEFLVNMVLTPRKEIVDIGCGNYIKAHRYAVKVGESVFRVRIKKKVKLLIASSYPADLDFWQAAKAICNAEGAVENEGTLIIVTPCPEGIPKSHQKYCEYIGSDPDKLAEKIMCNEVKEKIIAAPAVRLGQIRKRIRIGIVSTGLRENEVKRMKFEYWGNIEGAISNKMKEYGKDVPISVMPYAGEIYTYL